MKRIPKYLSKCTPQELLRLAVLKATIIAAQEEMHKIREDANGRVQRAKQKGFDV